MEDIEALFDQVLKSISESNAGKLATKNFDKQMRKAPEEIIPSRKTYEQIVINAMRWFGMNNIQEIERMTQYEYELRMTAFQLKRLDREKRYSLASLGEQSSKKPRRTLEQKQTLKQFLFLRRLKDFFDYEKLENQIKGIDTDEMKFKDDNLKAFIEESQFLRKGGLKIEQFSVEAYLKATDSSFVSTFRKRQNK